ncbi:hypothetical protein MRB53_008122 [Persea americana]|uniref:Uncharacterized protein n=1 Tax=Persea americana TaxID=3435 RepID=A0ACC2MKW1_PERAE|nr:hypothetical protein MRB53_008122 [Persea americana]
MVEQDGKARRWEDGRGLQVMNQDFSDLEPSREPGQDRRMLDILGGAHNEDTCIGNGFSVSFAERELDLLLGFCQGFSYLLLEAKQQSRFVFVVSSGSGASC